jgi:S-adenosyl-L-methionine hydrolase (adenosine-forming)
MRSIAILTDFGTRDPYVAAMKGVLASRSSAALVDLTHEIAPFDIFEAAWFLRFAAREWPLGSVFLVVVDPGVGSARRMLALDDGARVFIAPDNGVLHFIDGVAHAITNESLFLPHGSTTFHGRDRFAPAAAAVAEGMRLTELGPRVDDRVMLDYTPGMIVRIDRFGNCITDVAPPAAALRVREHVIAQHATNYADAPDGPFLIVGSSGTLEISVKNASAAELLQLSRFDRVERLSG